MLIDGLKFKLMQLRPYVLYLIILFTILVVSISGCAGASPKTTGQTFNNTSVTMQDVDSALSDGPVFLEFGASWCEYCQQEKPIIQDLEKRYGSVTFINVDSDADWSLDSQFVVNGIPQMDVIVRKNPDESYLYVDAYGNTTKDLPASRIIGYTEESDLEKILNSAIAARKSG